MPGKEPKEPENIQTFSVDDYKDKLIEEGYSDATALMLSEKKRDKLAEQATKMEQSGLIEIDLSKL
jgi:hypothetical protein